MQPTPTIVFVCEHGAAKSIIAAAYFNKIASEIKSDVRAIARGTHPDNELSPKTISGLHADGLLPTELIPQILSLDDVKSAQQIISFCDVPEEYQNKIPIEHWNDIPPVSENYETARDAILENLKHLLSL